MGEVLTIPEIEARYPSEWVLLEDPEVDDRLGVVRGKVVFHSKDREEVHKKDRELRPRSAAHIYTGAIPEDAVIVL